MWKRLAEAAMFVLCVCVLAGFLVLFCATLLVFLSTVIDKASPG